MDRVTGMRLNFSPILDMNKVTEKYMRIEDENIKVKICPPQYIVMSRYMSTSFWLPRRGVIISNLISFGSNLTKKIEVKIQNCALVYNRLIYQSR